MLAKMWLEHEKYLQKCDKNRIIPIEVKASKLTNNISLTRYNEKFNNDVSIRFSMNNLKKDGKILNIPLFLIEYMDKFIIN